MRAAAPASTIRGTIMFTDIVGFTEFTALRGDGEALALLTAQEQIVRSVLGGPARIVKDMGDGLMIWFEDPCAAIEAAPEFHRTYGPLHCASPDGDRDGSIISIISIVHSAQSGPPAPSLAGKGQLPLCSASVERAPARSGRSAVALGLATLAGHLNGLQCRSRACIRTRRGAQPGSHGGSRRRATTRGCVRRGRGRRAWECPS